MTASSVLKGWIVLVVDDEYDSRMVAEIMLEDAGARVISATNGREALDRLRQEKPQFILSDLSMPVMDGWQLMAELNNNRATADIPVIALTAHAMVGDRERALAAGFRNHITKPLSADKFMTQLLAILEGLPEFSSSFE